MQSQLPKASEEHAETLYLMRDLILKRYQDKIAFIILFGSFARGNWVYDSYIENDINYVYASDYDVLVLTKKGKNGSGYQKSNLQERIEKTLAPLFPLYQPHKAHIIVESMYWMNEELRKGQYFFSDIKKEGVCLYDSGEFKLKEAGELTCGERKEIAEEHFAQWFKNGNSFLLNCGHALARQDYNNAAFELHQATESLFNCTLLVLTGYKPKSHDIKELLRLCASQKNEFLTVFPKGNEAQKTRFKLLRKAYIEARYHKDYVITEAQLQYLIGEVEKLKAITEKVCQEQIDMLSE